MDSGRKIFASPGLIVGGRIRVPGDKSISHRALMLGAMAEGQTRIRGFLPGEDCLATMAALRALGVTIDTTDPDCIVVEGVGLHGLRAADRAARYGQLGHGYAAACRHSCGPAVYQ